jgi:hypothetical protein
MINYKFRSCYKKIDIYKPVGFSTADRALSVAHWPIGYRLLLDAPWPTCMLLCRHACYCSGVCGAPHDKFRGQKYIFKVQGPAVHHVTSSGGQKCIFKVQGPMWHKLISSGACGAFNSLLFSRKKSNWPPTIGGGLVYPSTMKQSNLPSELYKTGQITPSSGFGQWFC